MPGCEEVVSEETDWSISLVSLLRIGFVASWKPGDVLLSNGIKLQSRQ
jgi:hypothetical protein